MFTWELVCHISKIRKWKDPCWVEGFVPHNSHQDHESPPGWGGRSQVETCAGEMMWYLAWARALTCNTRLLCEIITRKLADNKLGLKVTTERIEKIFGLYSQLTYKLHADGGWLSWFQSDFDWKSFPHLFTWELRHMSADGRKNLSNPL